MEAVPPPDALQRAADGFDVLFGDSPDPASIVSTAGVIVKCNWAMEQLCGLPRGGGIGLSVFDVSDPEELATEAGLVADVLKGRTAGYRMDKWVHRPDGAMVRVRLHCHGLVSNGRVAAFFGTTTDVTHEQRALDALLSSERRYRSLFDAVPLSIIEYGANGRVLSWNQEAEELFGWSETEAIGASVPEIPPSQIPLHKEVIRSVLRDRRALTFTSSAIDRRGDTIDTEVHASPAGGDDGTPLRMMTIVIDRRAQQRAASELATKEQRLSAILHHVRDAVFEVDDNDCFTFVSGAMERLTGIPSSWFIGRSARATLLMLTAEIPDYIDAAIARGDSEMRIEVAIPDSDRWLELVATVAPEPGITCRGVVYDITDRKRREVRLQQRASTDPLTGIANREELTHRLDAILAEDPDRSVGVCFFDLDGFKAVNDSWGHAMGDHVLTLAARALEAGCRDGDTVGRFGGDEFVVVFGGIVDRADAVELASRLRQRLLQPIDIEGTPVVVGASFGVATGSLGGGATSIDLIRQADQAMYDMKRSRTVGGHSSAR
jgi:diguanylate cyclase (GGDEF)-like protein/PAS domain S-box-containing protein